MLFSGSLRMNLDPLKRFSDSEVWQAIERAHLKSFMIRQSSHLQMDIGEGGLNLRYG